MMKNSFIPEDLLLEILSLLPIKSVCRFKCVCKSWYVLFKTTSFISTHHLNNNSSTDLLVTHRARHGVRHTDTDVFTIHLYNKDNDHAFDTVSGFWERSNNNDSNNDVCWSRPRLVGSYNGLVCLADTSLKEIAIWNPATRQVKVVAYYHQPSTSSTSKNYDKPTCLTYLAFGYDSKTSDYKVMRLIGGGVSPEVYSFNKDSWRNSDAVVPRGFYSRFNNNNGLDEKTVCVNGYYSTMPVRLDIDILYTIDMSREVFIVTKVDLSSQGIWNGYYEEKKHRVLTEVNGSVALLTLQLSYGDFSFAIFVLDVYGAEGTWTRFYTLPAHSELCSPFPFVSSPVGLWNGDELLISNRRGGLSRYNLTTHELRSVEIASVYQQTLAYKESLVWRINEATHPIGT